MKNKCFEKLKEKHKGIGGLYFITTNIICSFIMVIALQLSWNSQVVAMADNLLYIASINHTVNNYIANTEPYDEQTYYPSENSDTYNPLNDFNNMLKSAGLSKDGASECKVKWTGTKTYIQVSKFTTSLGTEVRPHQQESTIENY